MVCSCVVIINTKFPKFCYVKSGIFLKKTSPQTFSLINVLIKVPDHVRRIPVPSPTFAECAFSFCGSCDSQTYAPPAEVQKARYVCPHFSQKKWLASKTGGNTF